VPAPVPVRPRAVLFDMDGTLTRPAHDFALIKAEMGLPPGAAILEELGRLDAVDPARSAALRAILEGHERRAAEAAEPREGAEELIRALHRLGIRTAVITRNARRFVETTLRRIGLDFDVVITREDAEPKPSPEPLRLACARLGVVPGETWMVGDFLYDIAAGQAAGCAATVLLREPSQRPFEHSATHVIDALGELLALLEASGPPAV
jgi:HAD superfamily hydrolase (TIGR01509 family)